MSVSYSGHSCRYDKATGTYSRPAVSIKYPCSSCGANRPLKQGSLMPDLCPCKMRHSWAVYEGVRICVNCNAGFKDNATTSCEAV
jgi:hypothetical protein